MCGRCRPPNQEIGAKVRAVSPGCCSNGLHAGSCGRVRPRAPVDTINRNGHPPHCLLLAALLRVRCPARGPRAYVFWFIALLVMRDWVGCRLSVLASASVRVARGRAASVGGGGVPPPAPPRQAPARACVRRVVVLGGGLHWRVRLVYQRSVGGF